MADKIHLQLLITGLGSSLVPWIWSRWAAKLEKALLALYKDRDDVLVLRASSDGLGEKRLFATAKDLFNNKALASLCIAGHSNGFRDGLLGCAQLYPEVKVNYFAGIDMALLDGVYGAEAKGSIKVFDEFHAQLEYANFHKSFKSPKNVHHLFEVKKGHTAAASDEFVQSRIFNQFVTIAEGGNAR